MARYEGVRNPAFCLPPADLFAGMHLAEMEREILGNVPLHSFHLLLFFVPPLLITLVLLIAWRRQFGLGHSRAAKPGQVEVKSV